ncbi:beta-lactamase-like protein [Candidatus Koribacter versatilis Ellin345]|uniref:Beta-lactamase-like protein n=1 Tax=Koribacter versatilis (strain Ellin345) TaxID=204669 RepID=Q1IQE8_KORVE|nr:MBL fold metallo-hydrolase [Candidatus Koribacter versatilis]ABF40902.1 beta-lactamase-like protein [Candidatus Koribacter versatilis Ellin345]
MIHEIFPVGPLQCNCSVIGDETTHEAIVIDPGDEVEVVVAILEKHQLRVTQIVVTHAHIDHVGGAMKLKALTGAPLLLNENDDQLLKLLDVQASWLGMKDPGKVVVDESLADGDSVKFGTIEGSVIHTPGHTQGSICLLLKSEKTLIAGDTLFQGSIGRTDLPGGSYEKIMKSIHGKLLVLPGETIVIPGHGPSTTIEEERERNPFLRG